MVKYREFFKKLRVDDGFSRTIEQNIYWTIANALKGRTVDERIVASLAHDLLGEKVEVKRDGSGGVYVSQDSLEELLLSKL